MFSTIWLYVRNHRSERGASAVEYGLLVAGIAAVIIGGVFLFGNGISSLFDESCDSLTTWVRGNGGNCTP